MGRLTKRIVKFADEDWYKINVPASRTLNWIVRFVHANGDIDLELYGSCSSSALLSSNGTGDREEFHFRNDTNRTITAYLRVHLSCGPENCDTLARYRVQTSLTN